MSTAVESDRSKAEMLLATGRVEEARGMLSRIVAAEPENVLAWCSLANAHLRLKEDWKAIECANRAIALAPDLEWPHRIVSIAHWGAGRGRAAVAAARESVRLAPHLAIAHGQLARALALAGVHYWRESKREADEALRLAPNDPQIHCMAGDAALRSHRYKLAEQHYLAALAINPDNHNALNNLSIARLRQLRLLSAANGFKSVAALDPASDLGRRNIDATIGRFLLVLVWLLAVISALTLLNRWAATLAFLVPLTVLVVAIRTRRLLNSRTWSYVWRRPFQRRGLPILGGLVILGTAALIASLSQPAANVQTIAGTVAFWLGFFGSVQIIKTLAA